MRTLRKILTSVMVATFLFLSPLTAKAQEACQTAQQIVDQVEASGAKLARISKGDTEIKLLAQMLNNSFDPKTISKELVFEKDGVDTFAIVLFDKQGCYYGHVVVPESVIQSTVGSEWRNGQGI